MRNRVHVSKSEYKVNPEKGVVICILECETGVDRTDVWSAVSYRWWKKRLPFVDFYGKFTVKAIARCNKDDKFDEVIGKRIAESRAKSKAYKVAGKFWLICSLKIKDMVRTCLNLKEACRIAEVNEIEHIKELSK